MKNKKHLDVHAANKAAAVTFLTRIAPEITALTDDHLVFRYPKTPETEAALEAFFRDEPLPMKSYSELVKNLQYQLMSLKREQS